MVSLVELKSAEIETALHYLTMERETTHQTERNNSIKLFQNKSCFFRSLFSKDLCPYKTNYSKVL